MEVKREEITDEKYEEMKKIANDFVCGECGADLQLHTVPERGTLRVGCFNQDHHGLVERLTYTQALRRGEDIHPTIRDHIERKMMPKDELGRAMNLLALRYPRAIVDPPTAALFIMDCTRLDLDPLISPAEAVPVPFKSKKRDARGNVIEEKTTITMIITEDGWLSMAARGCPDRWAGAPSVELVDNKALAESLCGDPDAWLWMATGRTKDMEPDQVTIAYGYYTRNEHKKAEESHTPAATQPGNQARVRAIKRWVRENFPECRQRMMDLTAEWYQRSEGIKEAQEYIDAEYSFISPKSDEKIGDEADKGGGGRQPAASNLSSLKGEKKPKKSGAAPPAAEPAEEKIEGEGFYIDLPWLRESLNALKWTDETAKTFLVSKYKVSPQGTLEDVIKRLTLEQAEEFVKEIQERVDQKQMQLFE